MKDITARDLYPRRIPVLTQVSIKYQSSWLFISLNNAIYESSMEKVYRLDYTFGLVESEQPDPSKFSVKGNPGDYIIEDSFGTYIRMTPKEYRMKYPTPNKTKKVQVRTSKNLKDPNYLTKVLQESPTSSYNRPTPKNP